MFMSPFFTGTATTGIERDGWLVAALLAELLDSQNRGPKK